MLSGYGIHATCNDLVLLMSFDWLTSVKVRDCRQYACHVDYCCCITSTFKSFSIFSDGREHHPSRLSLGIHGSQGASIWFQWGYHGQLATLVVRSQDGLDLLLALDMRAFHTLSTKITPPYLHHAIYMQASIQISCCRRIPRL